MTEPATSAPARAAKPARHHPLLDTLAGLYPGLFGETPKPLKRGVFEDLVAAHPEALPPEALKAAMALHTRSSRYLAAVASGQPRHGLDGTPVEPVAPEQRHHALVEVHRRRQGRDPRHSPQRLRERIGRAFEDSGLGPESYLALVAGRDEGINALTRDAVEWAVAQRARDAALRRAFEASGLSVAAFADAHGLTPEQARRLRPAGG